MDCSTTGFRISIYLDVYFLFLMLYNVHIFFYNRRCKNAYCKEKNYIAADGIYCWYQLNGKREHTCTVF